MPELGKELSDWRRNYVSSIVWIQINWIYFSGIHGHLKLKFGKIEKFCTVLGYMAFYLRKGDIWVSC